MRGRFGLLVMCVFAFLVQVGYACAKEKPVLLPTTGMATTAPDGYYPFCRNYPGECNEAAKPAIIKQGSKSWRLLMPINAKINTLVEPMTDLDNYGESELWMLPDIGGTGDCEDYVLLKRRTLIDKGVPAGALALVMVYIPGGEGHLVLVAHTTAGDLVLDNLQPSILAWHKTGYKFAKSQDPYTGRWLDLGGIIGAPAAVAALRQ